jgi:uncharacterized protein YbbC (DUF1343 family)
MARYVNRGLEKPARLKVVAMKGWKRSMTWEDTGLPWIPPSPNLRSPEAALAYPGIALMAITNVSEGRGTESPFLVFGAPWLRPSELPAEVPGFKLEPTTFTPIASSVAPEPIYVDQKCQGMAIRVTDRAAAEPYRLGVALLVALQSRPEFEWSPDGAAVSKRVGTPRLLDDLRRGKTVEEIIEADRADHEEWRRARESALLY